VVDKLLGCGSAAYLVVGYRWEEVTAAVAGRDVTIVVNPGYERGMLSSVQAGVAALRAEHKWFLVMPVDIPLVTPQTVSRLMAEARPAPARSCTPRLAGAAGTRS